MAERRGMGGRLLKAGKLSQAEIARQLGVSRVAVNQWAKTVAQGGLRGLKSRKVRGGRSKLTTEQHRRLKQIVKQGAQASGFETERWTLERVNAPSNGALTSHRARVPDELPSQLSGTVAAQVRHHPSAASAPRDRAG